MERRDFVAAVAAGVARWDPGASPRGQPRRRHTADRPTVGIQVGAVSFVDEGTDKVLDEFRELATINTLFLATFTYGRGIAGRQLRGQPLPDHGAQAYDDDFRGGNFATPHPQYYRETSIVPEKAPEHPGYDVIADVLPAARRRGMRLYCWFEDVFRRDVPGFDRAAEIDLDRAREGYLALERWATALRAGQRPTDGAFVTFWRLLVKYPELLAWERLWNEGLNDTYRDLYRLAKRVAPDKGIGWHIWHNNSFSPFYRAEQDYAEFARYSDFLKVVMYNNCGGPRLAQYVRNAHATLFADLTPEQVLDFTYGVQQYRERPLDRIAADGLSADYVLRETCRAVAGAGPRLRIWPGIDIDIPTGANDKKTQPEDVYQAVRAAFQGGAHGVLLSRKYSEMKLANLRAAGRAVRELAPA